jgi:hypothetical protein
MPDDKAQDASIELPDSPPWTFAASRALHLRKGLELSPAERLRWLENAIEELLPWVGRARLGRPVDPR